MVGGGSFGWEPGEWTDATSMAIAIAEVAATGADLRDEEALDAIVRRWGEWMHDAKDVGIQTRNVLRAARWLGLHARTAREGSAALHERTGRTAGNGSLMRTAPVALAYLDDEAALVVAARSVSELTHYDPEAGDACVLWCLAIRHAILTGELDVRIGLQHIDADRRDLWASRLDVAEASHPSDFTKNGWVIEALQGAWSVITTTPVPQDDPAMGVFRADHLRLALDAAVMGGGDTDTVAAIAGGFLGAAYGASAVPAEWRRVLHGWPGLSTRGSVALATRIVNADIPFVYDSDPMIPVQHPHDQRGSGWAMSRRCMHFLLAWTGLFRYAAYMMKTCFGDDLEVTPRQAGSDEVISQRRRIQWWTWRLAVHGTRLRRISRLPTCPSRLSECLRR